MREAENSINNVSAVGHLGSYDELKDQSQRDSTPESKNGLLPEAKTLTQVW